MHLRRHLGTYSSLSVFVWEGVDGAGFPVRRALGQTLEGRKPTREASGIKTEERREGETEAASAGHRRLPTGVPFRFAQVWGEKLGLCGSVWSVIGSGLFVAGFIPQGRSLSRLKAYGVPPQTGKEPSSFLRAVKHSIARQQV